MHACSSREKMGYVRLLEELFKSSMPAGWVSRGSLRLSRSWLSEDDGLTARDEQGLLQLVKQTMWEILRISSFFSQGYKYLLSSSYSLPHPSLLVISRSIPTYSPSLPIGLSAIRHLPQETLLIPQVLNLSPHRAPRLVDL